MVPDPVDAVGASLTALTVTDTVHAAEVAVPSLAVKRNVVEPDQFAGGV
jgi:hypothetical protein